MVFIFGICLSLEAGISLGCPSNGDATGEIIWAEGNTTSVEVRANAQDPDGLAIVSVVFVAHGNPLRLCNDKDPDNPCPGTSAVFDVENVDPTDYGVTGVGTYTLGLWIEDDNGQPSCVDSMTIEIFGSSEKKFRPTSSLANPRTGHSSTLLATGEILVAGGWDGQVYRNDSEIYDPTSGTWRSAGSLEHARSGHSAIRLTSGKVLVVAGQNGSTSISAELFDPETETWMAMSSDSPTRTGHSATLLESGEVLVVGGTTNSEVDLVEIYSAAGIRRVSRSIPLERAHHTATLLHGGDVLVTGGFRNGLPLRDSRRFDPQSGMWAEAPPMLLERGMHTTTLLADGRLLSVAGSYGNGIHSSAEIFDPEDAGSGWREAGHLFGLRAEHSATLLPSGEILIAGGRDGSPNIGAQVFDPIEEEWHPVSGLLTARYAHSAVLLSSGQVLISGGMGAGNTILSSAEVFDPVPFVWFRGPKLATARARHSTTFLSDGRLLVAGGENFGAVDEVEVYDPASGDWAQAEPLRQRRHRHTATLMQNGDVLVTGGADGTQLASAEIYSTGATSWTLTEPMAERRMDHTATLLPSGEVLVVGGITSNGDVLPSAEIYNPEDESWRSAGLMEHARRRHQATLLPSGVVLITGGETTTNPTAFLPGCEIYDPRTNEWTRTAPLNSARSLHSATLLSSGKVLVAGGYAGSATSSAEIYDPASASWADAAFMEIPRARHTATLMTNGTVLVAGGYRNGSLSTAEIYDPALDVWQTIWRMREAREQHSATLLTTGEVLLAGGYGPTDGQDGGPLSSVELLTPAIPAIRRPQVTSVTSPLTYGNPLVIEGPRLRGDSETSSGGTRGAATDLPLIQIQSIEDASLQWLIPSASNLVGSPHSLTVDRFPSALTPGWHRLWIVASGTRSAAIPIHVDCSLVIVDQPADQIVEIGASATFEVDVQGARRYQWLKDGEVIPGAVDSSYTTVPITPADSGAEFTVEVDNGCTLEVSDPARLIVADDEPPYVEVLFPNGGEIFVTSDPEQKPNQEWIRWISTDNIRLCKVEISLWVSTDGGNSYEPAPTDSSLPAELGSEDCPSPGVQDNSLIYLLSSEPPVPDLGARYKVEVSATDQAMQTTTVRSQGYFQIVEPAPDSIETLILTHPDRMQDQMGLEVKEVDDLMARLAVLAGHSKVNGLVLNLGDLPNLSDLYASWDATPENPLLANQVLFAEGGVHGAILDRLGAYPNLRYVVIVGDDGIIPMARMPDRGFILRESDYVAGGDLNLDPSRGPVVPLAYSLDENFYLSDDPIALSSALMPEELPTGLIIPDLMVGRLVETPLEIMGTVDLFIARGGGIDLTEEVSQEDHKVQVTSYDFLIDAGRRIRQLWKAHFGSDTPDDSTTPVDGSLVDDPFTQSELKNRLCGEGTTYSIINLNGHANHYQEGVPGTDPLDIVGVEASELAAPNACTEPSSSSLSLDGAVVYSVGCHGGLSVRGSSASDINHSLDLPQTMLAIGAQAYLSNSGYGWGLRYGVGYSEQLVNLFTSRMIDADRSTVGEVFKRAKLAYFQQNPYFDGYDEKTLMQWVLYGLPMYSVRVRDSAPTPGTDPLEVSTESSPYPSKTSPVRTKRDSENPPFLLPTFTSYDLDAEGIYSKWTGSGEPLELDEPCPAQEEGCYYERNRASIAKASLPIEPILIEETRVSGNSQHGALWLGATYVEETGWKPVIGEPVSNGGQADADGLPLHIIIEPIGIGFDPESRINPCRGNDEDFNSLVITTGETLKQHPWSTDYDLHRLYQTIDVELFYYNNHDDPSQNCDRTGPQLGAAPFDDGYHHLNGNTLSWTVPASDEAGVWRVVVVYTDGRLNAEGLGSWAPLDLTDEGDGTWTGSVEVDPNGRISYVIQSVDTRGNVSWLRQQGSEDRASTGLPRNLPLAVPVDPSGLIFSDGFESGDSSRWSQSGPG